MGEEVRNDSRSSWSPLFFIFKTLHSLLEIFGAAQAGFPGFDRNREAPAKDLQGIPAKLTERARQRTVNTP